VFGAGALVVGVPHFLGGFGLLVAHAAARVDPAIRIPVDPPPPWFAAIFVCSGTFACYLGCRPFGGRRTLGVLEYAALLALRLSK
jgi:hypothetical protein